MDTEEICYVFFMTVSSFPCKLLKFPLRNLTPYKVVGMFQDM